MKKVFIILYFILLCCWLWLSAKDYFHMPQFMSEKTSAIVGCVLTIVCLAAIIGIAIKQKTRKHITLAIIGCILTAIILFIS